MNSFEKLKNPDALMRPAPFWSWNDKLDESELRRQVREMADKGWGSFFMHSRVGLVTGYLSDEWMELCNSCADEAARNGVFSWLYDEDKWPSGYAGGIVPSENEAYRSRGLVLLKAGTATADDTVLCSVRHGGIDYDICKRVSPLSNTWFGGYSFVDLMNPEAVRAFLNCTHEKYKEHCGHNFGKSILGVFTDEPCYLMFADYQVPVVPWSEYLPGFFSKMAGYDLRDCLPELFFDIEGYRKVRFDFYNAATELFRQSFTIQYSKWCEENGLIMTGHFMSEDWLWFQTQWSGDVMSHYEHMHWPGVDKLGRDIDHIVTMKQLSSAVDQLNKEKAFCETFGCSGGQTSFFHRKWIGDWQAVLGISFINHHLSLYSMRGERKRDYPANLFYQQPWWEDERGFSDYFGRLCAAVTEGHRIVNTLVLQPLSSVWSEYSPLHAEGKYIEERVYDDPFAALSKRLMAEKIDYHYGNETLMARHGAVEGKSLRIGAHSYGSVLVPPSMNMRSSTLELLKQYANAGGRLIFIGRIPDHIDGLPAVVDIPGSVAVPNMDDAIGMLDNLYPDRVMIKDVYTGKNAPTVWVHSRSVGDSTRHLLVNTDEIREVRARVTVPNSAGRLTVFDLYDGSCYALASESATFDVTLAPGGSLLVISGEGDTNDLPSVPAVLGSGALFLDISKCKPVQPLTDFECEVMEDNVLLLNDFALDVGGRRVYEGPVCGAWHEHFYSAEDGTAFRATYTFSADCTLEGCYAAIETAENLDSITFNGIPLRPMKARGEAGEFDASKSWKDISFTRVPLPAVQQGTNILVIEGKKVNNITGAGCHRRIENWQDHEPTEAEEVYILGRFNLVHIDDSQYVMAAPSVPAGKNLTDEGFPFYSGRIRLKAGFTSPDKVLGRVLLSLNGAAMASAHVRVNGQDCGTVMWRPYLVDISSAIQPGDNSLEIEMSTTLVNAFGPNRNSGIKDARGISPWDFIDMARFQRKYELFDFGLDSATIFIE